MLFLCCMQLYKEPVYCFDLMYRTIVFYVTKIMNTGLNLLKEYIFVSFMSCITDIKKDLTVYA